METTELQYPNEEKFKNNLVSYLQEHVLVDEMLPMLLILKGNGWRLPRRIYQTEQGSFQLIP